jgi:hypothetical protein
VALIKISAEKRVKLKSIIERSSSTGSFDFPEAYEVLYRPF